MKRNRLIIGGMAFGIIVVALTYPLWSPYFIDEVVDEPFPDLTDAQRDTFDQMPDDQQNVLLSMADENMEMAEETVLAMLEDDTEMAEDMPENSAQPRILAQGTFGEFDPVHRGSGTATIYELPDGSRFLRFEDFRVTNGPDLHVILTSEIPSNITQRPNDNYIDLGELKGNVGNQNYEIPADVDLGNYVGVVIYCEPFHVNFSVAELNAS